MEPARKIRLKIGSSVLRKRMERLTRKVSYSGIEDVKKIGIVWDAFDVSDFASLSRFYQRMSEKSIDVKILGYFPEKDLPDQYTAIRYLNFIRREEVSFLYLPVSRESESFIRNRFDILIDINFKNLLPLKYITSMSAAALKVGLYEPEKEGNTFDLMIEMKRPVNVDEYLNQVWHYLEMIRTEQVEKVH
jgi:hypothetical protein